jgi:hypothetical protein
MTTITARGQVYELHDEHFWHLTPARGSNLLNNAFVGGGICCSISAVRRMPGLGNAMTIYGAFGNVEKENAWERVRVIVDEGLPTRQHALFLFDDKNMADRARQTWFPNEDRLLVEARLVRGAITHRADSRWLNCQPPQWAENAEHYWHGDMTPDPLPEIVVCGAVYFPGWKNPPFGLLAGLVPNSAR